MATFLSNTFGRIKRAMTPPGSTAGSQHSPKPANKHPILPGVQSPIDSHQRTRQDEADALIKAAFERGAAEGYKQGWDTRSEASRAGSVVSSVASSAHRQTGGEGQLGRSIARAAPSTHLSFPHEQPTSSGSGPQLIQQRLQSNTGFNSVSNFTPTPILGSGTSPTQGPSLDEQQFEVTNYVNTRIDELLSHQIPTSDYHHPDEPEHEQYQVQQETDVGNVQDLEDDLHLKDLTRAFITSKANLTKFCNAARSKIYEEDYDPAAHLHRIESALSHMQDMGGACLSVAAPDQQEGIRRDLAARTQCAEDQIEELRKQIVSAQKHREEFTEFNLLEEERRQAEDITLNLLEEMNTEPPLPPQPVIRPLPPQSSACFVEGRPIFNDKQCYDQQWPPPPWVPPPWVQPQQIGTGPSYRPPQGPTPSPDTSFPNQKRRGPPTRPRPPKRSPQYPTPPQPAATNNGERRFKYKRWEHEEPPPRRRLSGFPNTLPKTENVGGGDDSGSWGSNRGGGCQGRREPTRRPPNNNGSFNNHGGAGRGGPSSSGPSSSSGDDDPGRPLRRGLQGPIVYMPPGRRWTPSAVDREEKIRRKHQDIKFDNTTKSVNWFKFKAAFYVTVASRNVRDEEKLMHLLDLLEGAPAKMAHRVAGDEYSEEAYIQVWNALESRYGGDNRKKLRLFDELRKWPKLKEFTAQNTLELTALISSITRVYGNELDATGAVNMSVQKLLPQHEAKRYFAWLHRDRQPNNLYTLYDFLETERTALEHAAMLAQPTMGRSIHTHNVEPEDDSEEGFSSKGEGHPRGMSFSTGDPTKSTPILKQRNESSMVTSETAQYDMIRTVPAFIVSASGQKERVWVALDSCSTSTNIDAGTAKRLNLKIEEASIDRRVGLLQSSVSIVSNRVSFTLQTLDGRAMYPVQAYTVQNLVRGTPVVDWRKVAEEHPHLKAATIPKSDPEDQVRILLGVDYNHLMIANANLQGCPLEPFAEHCKLGWSFSGRVKSEHVINHETEACNISISFALCDKSENEKCLERNPFITTDSELSFPSLDSTFQDSATSTEHESSSSGGDAPGTEERALLTCDSSSQTISLSSGHSRRPEVAVSSTSPRRQCPRACLEKIPKRAPLTTRSQGRMEGNCARTGGRRYHGRGRQKWEKRKVENESGSQNPQKHRHLGQEERTALPGGKDLLEAHLLCIPICQRPS